MPFAFYVFFFFAGSVGGFFSGLLGIGGGIVMFPLLFYFPPIFGFDEKSNRYAKPSGLM